MTLNHAWMLKGWLLAEHAPQPVMEAAEAVIASLTVKREISAEPVIEIAVPALRIQPQTEWKKPTEPETVAIAERTEEPPPRRDTAPSVPQKLKKTRNWSPEQRAAASERMRQRQAQKKGRSLGELLAPEETGAGQTSRNAC